MTFFDAWCFPPGVEPPARVEEARIQPGGAVLRFPALDGERVRALARALRARRERELAGRGAESVARTLGRVGRRFLDPGDPLRERALEQLPATAGLSAPMAREVLDGMARDWTPDRLLALLRREFDADPSVLDGFRPRSGERRRVRAVGPELCFQIAAGTVPGVSVTALLRGLLVKSAVVLKPGRGDAVLPVLFARGLAEEDPELARAVAVAYWPGGREEVEDVLLRAAEVVVAYGSEETVRSLRDRTPVAARFVAYRHRVSAALVGREALKDGTAAKVAAGRAARAAAIFDQRGCVSPHVVYVEEGGAVDPRTWAEDLARALEELEKSLPTGPLSAAEASEIQQLRGTAELRASAGEGVRVHHGGSRPWTVLLEDEPGFRPSCLGRVLRVRPVADLQRAVAELGGVGRYLQTVALEGAGRRRGDLAEALARTGAVRITTLERAPWPPPWWHHDGAGALRALVRWVDLEGEEPRGS